MTLFDRMLDRYLRAGMLFSIDLELTWRCPLRCIHGYQRGVVRGPELTTDEWLRVLDEARALGALRVGLTGGEVLLRRDLPALLARAAELGMRIYVKTTGNGATSEGVSALLECRPANVDISFYSDRGAAHDRATGIPGSFDHSVGLARRLREAGIPVRAVFTPLAGIAEGPEPVVAGLAALGFEAVTVNRFDPTLCTDRAAASRLVPSTAPAPLPSCGSEVVEGGAALDGLVCGAGSASLLVGPDGRVQPCHSLPLALGNVLETRLQEIWTGNETLLRLRALRRRDLVHCAHCPTVATCAFCPGEAWRATGELVQPVPAFCARLRGETP